MADISLALHAVTGGAESFRLASGIGAGLLQIGSVGFVWMWSTYRPEPPESMTEYIWSKNKRLSLLGTAVWCAVISLSMLWPT
ncbi:hypothetical protein R77567_01065 [Ralstonia sp. LMG 32965]|uniref:Transmembrane protein n=2 Tax=Ralstonia flatus TaxID=3058601 RepID=A0AAD2BX53_9RALS|nr:hypothetical protein R77567_01065 [Ralstonia sp. LMG 32965]CAJ0863718.1 hypothetical protein R77564_01037 [Ralstonia sp. LMG 32965]